MRRSIDLVQFSPHVNPDFYTVCQSGMRTRDHYAEIPGFLIVIQAN